MTGEPDRSGRTARSGSTAIDLEPQPARDHERPAPGRTAPKGRPTPKRRDQEAQRRKPIVPADREAAKREAKERARTDRVQRREAVARGDESALAPRDRGPIKRYIRDKVDSRLSVGELFMPLVLVMLAVSLVRIPVVQIVSLGLIWLIIVVGVVDAIIRWQGIRRGIQERFGQEPPKGSKSYAIMRSFQMRMTRMPRPQVKRGDSV